MAIRCRCQRCSIRGLMGPAILITIGVLFLIHQSHWDYGFGRTWPVILLVIGAVKLAEALASDEGHGTVPGPPSGPSSGTPPGPQQGSGPFQGPPPLS
jgi:hypothetical protein